MTLLISRLFAVHLCFPFLSSVSREQDYSEEASAKSLLTFLAFFDPCVEFLQFVSAELEIVCPVNREEAEVWTPYIDPIYA